MAIIASLPTELKNTIVGMVAAQDAAYRQRKVDGIFADASDVDIATEWHGRGISSLFQVSKEWSELAAPFVYEVSRLFAPAGCNCLQDRWRQTLRASEGSSYIFQHHIARRRGWLVKHLVDRKSVV